MTEKYCRTCERVLPLEKFSLNRTRKSGYQSACKDCHKVYIKAYEAANRERISSRKKTFRKENRDRVTAKQREYYRRNTIRFRENERARLSTPEGKAVRARSDKKFQELHPDKYRARYMLRNAVAAGTVIRQPCAFCGNPKSEGHHEDYSKPFDVVWACRKCHREKFHGHVVVAKDGVK